MLMNMKEDMLIINGKKWNLTKEIQNTKYEKKINENSKVKITIFETKGDVIQAKNISLFLCNSHLGVFA